MDGESDATQTRPEVRSLKAVGILSGKKGVRGKQGLVSPKVIVIKQNRINQHADEAGDYFLK